MRERVVPIDTAPEPAPKVHFRINHLHGLYTFVWKLARRPSETTPCAATYFDTPDRQRLLADFADLVPFGASLCGAPAEPASQPWNLDRLCAVAAGHARDISDFRERLTAWMPHVDVSRLAYILEQFRPMYDDLVWLRSEPVLRRWQRFLQRYARRRGLEALIGRIARFYATTWDPAVPFRVLLHPTLTGDRVSATIDSNVVTLYVPGEPRDAARYLGIVTHEMCHGFDECRRHRLNDIREATSAGDASALAVYSRLALDEALATVIGNGWAVSRLAGRLPGGPLYDNWHIQTYAAALHSLVDEYLDRGKTLDQAFFEHALMAYQSAIGDRMWDYENVFAHVVVLADEGIRSKEGSAAARLAAHVDYLANAEELDGINEDNLERLLKGSATRLVVLMVGNDAGLRDVRARVDWLRQVHFPRHEPFVAGRVGGDDPALFLCSIASLTDLENALDELQKHWITEGILAFAPRLRTSGRDSVCSRCA